MKPKPDEAAPAGAAEWQLRLLVAASLILPLAIFTIASWISYREHFEQAEDRLQRTATVMQEHAAKVFETFEVTERYMEELFNDVSNDEIRKNEADYSARIRSFIKTLPQLRDLWVIDENGHPLVSGTVFPMPRGLDLSDRAYFQAQKRDDPGTYIGEVVHARAANTDFFAVTRKRLLPDRRFGGVYLVSIVPQYFSNYYATLPDSRVNNAGLLRADGALLARYPALPPRTSIRLPADSPVMRAIHEYPEGGLTRGTSAVDGIDRIAAYRKLPGKPVYVFVGIDVSTIVHEWMRDMSVHLYFGIPATLAMFTLAWLTLRNTRGVSAAYGQLRDETVRRRTTELALRQAQKMEAVGRLTGGIAHDFNNLLTAIIGNVELALPRVDPADERMIRWLTAVRQASLRAATLVQRLLSFSRQHPQEIKRVDINRLIGEMSELLHRTIGETIRIETVLASGLWKTAIDPNQLENAILNLAVNARDAMSDGGKLTIESSNAYLDEAYTARAGGDVKPGQYVMVAVSDTGAGMPADVREHAFEPFFTTKPTGAGSGLGLSMVYGFVKQSNGHIQIYSEPGQGTSIKMYFPRLDGDGAYPDRETPERPVEPRPDQHHECILLVEDDEDVSRYVIEALSEFGYRVEHAGTAAEALVILQKTPDIALLFTDVVLPDGMNGRELAREAKKLRPDLPVLFATGYTRNAIIHHGRLDADVELLTKPFTTETLARKVRQVLDQKAG